jgi:ribonuclease P protein component
VKSEGFPKRERVREGEEFTRILQNGERIRGRFLSVFWVLDEPGEERRANRVGIAVGKRLGKAVIRNRLRRRIREAYRRNKRELPCRGIAIIFMASPKMIGKDAHDVAGEVTWLLRSISASAESRFGPFERSSSSTEG